MNYFEFYEIPVSFGVDEVALQKRFYALSKQYHPDFYTLESAEKQAEILRLSTLNNEAYETLRDEDRRMKYVLTLQEALGEEGTNKLPPAFLMEMMELNEGLMELEFDPKPTTIAHIQTTLEKKEQELSNKVAPLLDRFDANPTTNEGLEVVVDYYLKKRYLLRIRENLGKFVD
jgi:Fe-S protein assembly co-chaperone HscB